MATQGEIPEQFRDENESQTKSDLIRQMKHLVLKIQNGETIDDETLKNLPSANNNDALKQI